MIASGLPVGRNFGDGSILCGQAARIVVLCFCFIGEIIAGDGATAIAEESADSSIRYRRIYVPADNLDAWPRDGEKYLPIESDDFHAWIDAANGSFKDEAEATIQKARYSARLEGDELVECQGEWSIVAHGPSPTFLSLSGVSLAIHDARWQDTTDSPVRIGAWGRDGHRANSFGLEVPHSGELEFSWHVSSKPIHNGLEFGWRLPAATVARLDLDLPAGKEPIIDGGVVLGTRVLSPLADQKREGRLLWELALNPAAAKILRIVDGRDASSESANKLTLREETRYSITQRGLELEALWILDNAVHDRRTLTVPLPQGVQLVSATTDGRELSWRISKHDGSKQEAAILDLPVASAARLLRITVRAWQPLTLDEVWSLPRLRAREVFWQSGNMEITVSPQLEILSLRPQDCVQSGANTKGEPLAGTEVFRLAEYSPVASVRVIVARRQSHSRIRLGSMLTLTDPDISGRLVTHWHPEESSIHNVSGILAPGWVIESVETIPAGALGDWFIDERQEQNRINVQFARPVRAKRPVSIAITARLQRQNIGDPIFVETMRMVDWAEATVEQHLLTFQTVKPYALETLGQLPTVDYDTLDLHSDTLIADLLGTGKVYDLSQTSGDAGLRVALERDQYEVDIQLDAVYENPDVSLWYQLSIRPGTNGVDQLLVYATSPLGDDVHWTDETASRPVSAEKLPAGDPRLAGLAGEGELWLLRLPRPTTQALAISARTVVDWPARKRVPLLSLPESAQQRGRIQIHANSENAAMLEPHGMQAFLGPVLSLETTSTAAPPPIRAAYRYDPDECFEGNAAPVLWMSPQTPSGGHPLIVRNVIVESYYWPNGRAVHRATYELENEGANIFPLELPVDAVLNSVVLDGRVLEQPVEASSTTVPGVPLPVGSRSVTVLVYFETQQSPLTVGSKLPPPIVEDEIPILGGSWTVWLPPHLTTSDATTQGTHSKSAWRRRLFGPFARASGVSPFHPLRPTDWSRMFSQQGRFPLDSSDAESRLAGWKAYHCSFVGGEIAPREVAHPPATIAWAIAMFLLCSATGRAIRQRSLGIFVSFIALASSLALVLPIVFASVATGAVIGLLASLISFSSRREPMESLSPDSWSRASTVALPSILLAILAANVAHAEPASAPAESVPTTDATTLERVLIPVDEDGRSAGSKYFVSDRFLRKLLSSTEQGLPHQHEWLLLGAEYTGELRERADSPGLVAENWMLSFEVEVLARDTTVVLPLTRGEATWRETAMLDGVPLPLVWLENGRRCAIEIAEPGRYRLAISCAPRTVTEGRYQSVSLSIPPLSGTRLRVEAPKTLSGVTISGATVPRSMGSAAGSFNHELTASDRFKVQWPLIASAEGGAAHLTVIALHWLHVDREEMQLVTKYIIEGGGNHPDAFLLSFNRRWELLGQEDSFTLLDASDEPEGQRSIQIELPPEEVDRHEVILKWRLPNRALFGRLRLPAINVISLPVSQQWLGISTPLGVECDVLEGAGAAAAANEFLAIWGDAGEQPDTVMGNIRANVPLTLAMRPQLGESQFDEVVHVAAGRETIRVAYQAEIAPGREQRYQLQLLVPEELAIDEIELTESGRNLPFRWTRVGANRVNVFSHEPLLKNCRLALHGRTAVSAKGPTRVPRVSAVAASGLTQVVQLYRDEDTLVEMHGISTPGDVPAASRQLAPVGWVARPVGVYRLDKLDFDQARLNIQPNKLQITGPTLLTLGRDSGEWSAGLSGRWTVTQGQLDTLRLRGPPDWAGPFTIDSDAPAAMEFDASNALGPTLVIRFAESIQQGEEVNLDVRGVLAPPAQVPIEAVEIAVEPAVDGRRFLQVPADVDKEQIHWSTTGVRPASLPEELADTAMLGGEALHFEVVASQFQVAIALPLPLRQSAQVRLADTIVRGIASRAQVIETRLMLVAPELASCFLELPPGQEMVAVRLDDRPAIVQEAGEQRWKILLGPSQLPRVLDIVAIASRKGESITRIQRPVLRGADNKPISVDLSLWSIEREVEAARPRVAGASTVASTVQAALRLDRLVSIAEGATPAAESLAPDSYWWFHSWADWLSSLSEQTRAKRRRVLAAGSLSQVSRPTDEQITQASDRLQLWIEQCGELFDTPDLPDGLDAPSLSSRFAPESREQSETRKWIYCVADGDADSILIESPMAIGASTRGRVAGAAAILVVAAAGVWLLRRPAAADLLCRWPHAIAFLSGIAYWAWLRPSWLGILISFASLYMIPRAGWPGRSSPIEHSTVIRLPPGEAEAL